MNGTKRRVADLERKAGGEGGGFVVVAWGDDAPVTVNGETLTRAEFEERYPDLRAIDWPEAEPV